MKVKYFTFGCKTNQYDTELLRERMESGGAVGVEDAADADLCLINSCTVTAKADQECRQLVRRLLREAPAARVVVTGCYATHAPEDLRNISPKVEVYSNRDKESLPACLGFEVAPEAWGLSRFAQRARAFVKIQDGCRAPCRYCIIPRVRPDMWSRPHGLVLDEVRRLVESGHGEIVFTGIRLGLYRDRSEPSRPVDLVGLLERVIDWPGSFRIRLSSLEVTEIPDDLVRLASQTNKVCPHFHVPLQSADDGVLADMGRWYRFADYEERVAFIRKWVPDAGITADVLTGFPTESEAAFDATFRRVEGMKLSGLHAFPYSPRPGTDAAALKPLAPSVLRSRTRRLIDLSDRLKMDFRGRFAGARRWALSEGDGEGWTDNYIRVAMPSSVPAGTLSLTTIRSPKDHVRS